MEVCIISFLLFTPSLTKSPATPQASTTVHHSRASFIYLISKLHLPQLAVIKNNLRSNSCALFFSLLTSIHFSLPICHFSLLNKRCTTTHQPTRTCKITKKKKMCHSKHSLLQTERQIRTPQSGLLRA